MASLNIGEQIRSAIRPAQEGLFDLLRGIKAEQVKTNELLTMLMSFEMTRPGTTPDHLDKAEFVLNSISLKES